MVSRPQLAEDKARLMPAWAADFSLEKTRARKKRREFSADSAGHTCCLGRACCRAWTGYPGPLARHRSPGPCDLARRGTTRSRSAGQSPSLVALNAEVPQGTRDGFHALAIDALPVDLCIEANQRGNAAGIELLD